MTEQINIQDEKISITELKALAYDQTLIRDQAQYNLNVIQAEIAKREKVEAEKGKSK